MARSAYREAVASFEQALKALTHLPESARRATGHRSPARAALGARCHWVTWAFLAVSARGRGPRRSPRRPASAGTDLGLCGNLFLTSWATMTSAMATGQRALTLAAASGESSYRRGAPAPRAGLPVPGRLSSGRSAASGRRGCLDGARRYERFGQATACRVLPCSPRRVPCRVGPFAEGRPSGTKELRIAEVVAHPTSLIMASVGHRAAGPPPRGPGSSPSPCSNGAWPLPGADLALVPRWLRLGLRLYAGGPHRRAVPLLDAGDGADHGDGGVPAGALVVSGWGGLSAGGPSGGGTRPRRAGARARPAAPGTGPRGAGAAPPRRYRLQRDPRRSSRPKSTTARPWPWPTNLACARSRRTATGAWARCMPRPASGSRPVPSCRRPSRCTMPWR